MILDRSGQFSDRQAVTATAFSTNSIDLRQTGISHPSGAAVVRDIGPGQRSIPLAIAVVEAFNNLTSLTVTMEIDDSAAFSSPKTIATSPTYAAADLVPGKQLLMPDGFPAGTNERFVRLKYTVVGTAPTTGRITAAVAAGM